MPAEDGIAPRLIIQLFDKDEYDKDDFLGRLSIELREFSDTMPILNESYWRALKLLDTDVIAGHLLVRITSTLIPSARTLPLPVLRCIIVLS